MASRSTTLAERLCEASTALLTVVETVDDDRWLDVPEPGVWSVGKEVEHVAEAAVYHQWIVRLTIGEKVSSRRPPLERKQLTTDLSLREAVELVRQRTDEGERLLLELMDAQLDLPTRPPRANAQALSVMIERVLIGHYDTHLAAVETKVRRPQC